MRSQIYSPSSSSPSVTSPTILYSSPTSLAPSMATEVTLVYEDELVREINKELDRSVVILVHTGASFAAVMAGVKHYFEPSLTPYTVRNLGNNRYVIEGTEQWKKEMEALGVVRVGLVDFLILKIEEIEELDPKVPPIRGINIFIGGHSKWGVKKTTTTKKKRNVWVVPTKSKKPVEAGSKSDKGWDVWKNNNKVWTKSGFSSDDGPSDSVQATVTSVTVVSDGVSAEASRRSLEDEMLLLKVENLLL